MLRGNSMIYVNSKKQQNLSNRVCKSLVIAFLAISCNWAFAIDNPDAPDLVAEFKAREQSLIAAAENPNNGYRDYLLAYTNYLEFLDEELNTVYQNLRSKLPEDQKKQLKDSQVNWIKYRDLEFTFIENTWTKADFGSSSSISRGQYKASVVRNRVIQLMHYSIAY